MLLLHSHEPLAAAEIAAHLGLTPRMVRYGLADVQRWLGARDVPLTAKPGCGISVDAVDPVRRKLIGELESLTGYALLLSPTERMHLLILSLLTSSGPLVIKQLWRLVNVSRTTVLRDLQAAEAWLKGYDLRLLRRPNYGLKVLGAEYDVREATVSSLMAGAGEAHLLARLARDAGTAVLSAGRGIWFMQAVLSVMGDLDLRFANQMVARVESGLGLQFTDDSHVSLALYLAIGILRLQQGRRIEVCRGRLDALQARKEFQVAVSVAESIEHRYGLSFGELEIACIARHILGAEARRTIADLVERGHTTRQIPAEAWALADDMLAIGSAYLHPSLRVDNVLGHSLAFHITSALDQLRFDLPIRNPLLHDVKKRYPHIFEVARKACVVLSDRVGREVPEEEVGHVAMHFVAAVEQLSPAQPAQTRVLVICGAGVAAAWLLVSRIRTEFPEVRVVGVMSALDVQSRRDWSDVDVVVSTIPVQIEDVSILIVNPLLRNEDVDQLRQTLRAKTATGSLEMADAEGELQQPSLVNLISAETIRLHVPAWNWQAAVYAAGKLLLDAGAIEPRYIEAMREMVIQHGPYMVIWPGIALLHALPDDGVKRLCMSFMTLATPVEFGHSENDPVDIAIALGTVDTHSHVRALSQLQDLLSDEAAVQSMRAASGVLDVLALIAAVGDKPEISARHHT